MIRYFRTKRRRFLPAKSKKETALLLSAENIFLSLHYFTLVHFRQSISCWNRDEKFFEYRQIPELTDYVIVAQDHRIVVHYVRRSPMHWTVTEYTEPDAVLTFASLEASLSLAEIYRKVNFPTD